MNKNRFRTRVFPLLFISFNLKFKSIDDGTLDDEKLSKNIFEFDERWEEDRRGNCGILDDGKLSKNIFESKLIKMSYRFPANKKKDISFEI